jgi:hypothetical protein
MRSGGSFELNGDRPPQARRLARSGRRRTWRASPASWPSDIPDVDKAWEWDDSCSARSWVGVRRRCGVSALDPDGARSAFMLLIA